MGSKVFLLLFVFLSAQYSLAQRSIKCNTPDTSCVFRNVSEFIDIGGVSSNSYYEFHSGKVKFLAWDTKKPVVKYSKHSYLFANIHLELHSNDDTGRDEIKVFCDNIMLFNYYFCDDYLDIIIAPAHSGRLRFVVFNSNMKGKTAGAFEVRIWIKGKGFKKIKK